MDEAQFKLLSRKWWELGKHNKRISNYQAFHHDVSVHWISTGSDKIFAKCRCLDHRPNTLVPQRSRSRHSKIQWSTYTKIPRISGYRSTIPHHGNTIPHLISANENHLKSCKVAVESNSISVQWTDTSLISTVNNECTLFQAVNVSLLCFNH